MPPVRPTVVLDTNVVLDWLLFDDVAGREVGRAVQAGMLEWIATPAMRDEHFAVLDRRVLARWAPDAARLRTAWDTHCRLCAPPEPQAGPPIRSADPDDQMFVDLARAARATWLLTRDNALLDLATPLGAHGVAVMTPAAWLAAAMRDRPG